jgi:pimeloyl-ACP methyl ester carboxylesterase
MANTLCKIINVDGLDLFYRESGPPDAPTILLLHGFPTSSHQFRNLNPLLSHKYHVLAPDLPRFGFTTVPSSRDYTYTFASLTSTISVFLTTLSIPKFYLYTFDYGAPVRLHLALQRPHDILAVMS